MAFQEIKLYQTGTFVAGNRLLDPEQRSVQARMGRSNSLTSGHRACQGCGEALGARYVLDAAMRATDGKLVAVNSTGLPRGLLHALPRVVVAAAVAALAVRQRAGGRVRRRRGAAGDGTRRHPGRRPGRRRRHRRHRLRCLSGMFERNDDVLFVCYDNEGYMNTGVQRSGATPPAATTANTKALGPEPGNVFGQGKSVPLIAMAHEIPYVATATVAELRDLEHKVEKAMTFHGARYLHVFVPCPLGWRAASGGHDPARPAGQGERASSRSSRPRPARSPRCRGSGARSRSRTTCARRGATPTSSATPARPDVVARIQARADRNIARFGLLPEGDE